MSLIRPHKPKPARVWEELPLNIGPSFLGLHPGSPLDYHIQPLAESENCLGQWVMVSSFPLFLTTLSSALFCQRLAKLELHSPNEIWNQFKTTKVPYLMWLKFGLLQTLSGSSFPSTLIQVFVNT